MAQSVEHLLICKLKIAGLILGLEYSCWTISIDSALRVVPVFSSRFKKRAPTAQSVEQWYCDWKVSISNLRFKNYMRLLTYFLLRVLSLSFGGDLKSELR